MKILNFTLIFMGLAAFTSCGKKCETKIAACSEVAPTDEMCEAAFNRWFYNKSSNSCELINYSGCSEKGFATKEACESCKCE